MLNILIGLLIVVGIPLLIGSGYYAVFIRDGTFEVSKSWVIGFYLLCFTAAILICLIGLVIVLYSIGGMFTGVFK